MTTTTLITPKPLQAQTVTRIPLDTLAGAARPLGALRGTLRSLDETLLLRLVDYGASVWPARPRSGAGERLRAILQTGRSKWDLGERMDRPGLVERVPAGVQEMVEATISTSGAAGHVLSRAWAFVHGLEPNDSGAYSDAVRAVEIAAIGAVQPNNGGATLGTVIGQMRADGDWRLSLREHANVPSSELVLGMLTTLWYGHRDRHGSPYYSDVTHDEARAAVTLAATLVDWFESGSLARRPVPGA